MLVSMLECLLRRASVRMGLLKLQGLRTISIPGSGVVSCGYSLFVGLGHWPAGLKRLWTLLVAGVDVNYNLWTFVIVLVCT